MYRLHVIGTWRSTENGEGGICPYCYSFYAIVSETCTVCGAEGIWTNYCKDSCGIIDTGGSRTHKTTTKHSACNGTGKITKNITCSHSKSSSHYYCTHGDSYTSSSHD